MKLTVAARKGNGSQLLLCAALEVPPGQAAPVRPAPVVALLSPLALAPAAADAPASPVEVPFVVAAAAVPLAATPALLPPPIAPPAPPVDPFAFDGKTSHEAVGATWVSRSPMSPGVEPRSTHSPY